MRPCAREAVVGGPRRKALQPCLRQVSARDLERRWRRTTDQLGDRRTTVPAKLQVVCERERILDEIERRDPKAFAQQFARAGWRTPGSVPE